MQGICIKCKGRCFCGRISCPIMEKQKAYMQIRDVVENLKEEIRSASPAPFVGRVGYPYINVGLLAPPEKPENTLDLDNPRGWAKVREDIPAIISKRSSLINSRKKAGILEKNRFIDVAQEVAMATSAPDISLNLKERPTFSLNFDPYNLPIGAKAEVEKATLEENPKVNVHIEKAVSDTDLLSTHAITMLYDKGIEENQLSKLLSVGTLGFGSRRRLVPTRWSITAVDDNVGKNILNEIRDYPETDFLSFFGDYLGNYYLVLFFPDVWSFELFEVYLPKASWNQSDEMNYCSDYESFSGRKTYAENCAGGYYAARLPVLEYLKMLKKQSSVIVFRFITGEYTTPLGVWVCREATRDAMSKKPIEFASKELMINYAKLIIKKRFGADLEKLLKESMLLKNMNSQSKLNQFF
jgi:DNA repair protein NreA